MWGCWGWQAARTWVSVSPEMVGFPTPSGNLEPANQHAPSKKKGDYQGKAEKPANTQVWKKAREGLGQ